MTPQVSLLEYEIPLTSAIKFNLAGQQKIMNSRRGLLLHWVYPDQEIYTEVAPLPGFSSESLEQCKTQLLSLEQDAFLSGTCNSSLYPSVRFAIESGWYQRKHPFHTSPVTSCSLMENAADSKRMKIKAGQQPIKDDIDVLRQVIENLDEEQKIRVDANRSWTPEELSSLQSSLDFRKLDFIEEPLCSLHQYSDTTLPVAFDESLREVDPDKPLPSIFFTAKAWVVKPMLSGLERTLHLAALASENRIQFILSSSFESHIALEFYHSLAQDLQLKEEQGLDTLKYFAQDLQPARIKLRKESVSLAECSEVARLC